MTDMFTHAVILNKIEEYLDEIINKNKESEKEKEKGIRILDIGTGHGYLAFAVG